MCFTYEYLIIQKREVINTRKKEKHIKRTKYKYKEIAALKY